MIACADMKNEYNHASGAINRIDCALHQCVRVVPVPARMLKLSIQLSLPQPTSFLTFILLILSPITPWRSEQVAVWCLVASLS